jgi:hypothetical protein
VRPGDPVVYVANPLLYGEMEVLHVLKNGQVRCVVDPDARYPSFEDFLPSEIAPLQAQAA